MKRGKKRIIGLVIFAVAVALIAGYIKFFNGTFLYISTGLKDDVVLKAGNSKAYTWEADILLSDAKKEYENVFGSGVWSQSIEGVNMDDYVKEQVRSKLIRVKCMNLSALKHMIKFILEVNNILLYFSRTQKDAVSSAADTFFNALTQEQVSALNVTKDQIEKMFTEFAIADTLYDDVTSQINTEVSSDDARVITIQYICAGSKSDISSAKERLDNGESFYSVAKDFGGEEESETECKRGEMEQAFETAAFNLKTGETSSIVEAGGKYYIIRCTSDNEKSKTEANKTALMDEKKLEYFNSVFESYEASKYVEMNKKVWNSKKTANATELPVSFETVFNELVK